MSDDFDDDITEMLGGEDVVEKLHPKTRAKNSELLQLMLDICPPKDGVVSVAILAHRLGVTVQCIYNIVSRDRITYKRAKSILDLDEETQYSISDFADYII